jgi:hypothetical protein
VPEPSTIIMAIACCAVLVGVKALCWYCCYQCHS